MKVSKNHIASQMMERDCLIHMINGYLEGYNENKSPNYPIYAHSYQLRLDDLNKNNYKFYYISKNAQDKYRTIDFKKFFDAENWIQCFKRSYSGIMITEEYTCVFTITNEGKSGLYFHVLSNDTSNGFFTFSTLIIPKDCVVKIDDKNERAEYFKKVFPLDTLPDDQRVVMEGFMRMLFFIEFAEVKTIDVNPKNPKYGFKGHWNNEMFNDTNKKITVIDVGWDITVRTGVFSVQGHLRWQAYGEAHSKRKLIWIDEFEKEGYTKIAGKLKE